MADIDLSTITEEQIKALLESNDIAKKLVNAIADQRTTKGIETFKDKTLPAEIDKKVQEQLKALNPEMTTEQKELRELKAKFSELEKDKLRETNKSKAVRLFSKDKLPEELLDLLNYDNTDTIEDQIAKVKSVFSDKLSQAVESEVAKRTGRPAPGGTGKAVDNPLGYNPFDKDRFNITEIIKLEESNPELAKTLEKTAK